MRPPPGGTLPHNVSAARRGRRRGPRALCAATSAEWARSARPVAAALHHALSGGAPPSPTVMHRFAAVGRQRGGDWLAGSARRPNCRALTPGNARRNRTGRRRAWLQLVPMAACLWPSAGGPAEEELRLAFGSGRLAALPEAGASAAAGGGLVPARRRCGLRVPEPRSRSVVAQRHRAPFCKTASTLAALRLRHSSASRVPGVTPAHCAMKSERQEARIAAICSDVGCWARPPSKSPPQVQSQSTGASRANSQTSHKPPSLRRGTLRDRRRHCPHAVYCRSASALRLPDQSVNSIVLGSRHILEAHSCPWPASDIERLIRANIPDANVTIRDLAGDGDHMRQRSSPSLPRQIARAAAQDRLRCAQRGKWAASSHALALQTGTPEP